MLRLKHKAKKGKCVFLAKTIEYLGYRVDQSGLHTRDSKVAAIKEAPRPKNVYKCFDHFYGLSVTITSSF